MPSIADIQPLLEIHAAAKVPLIFYGRPGVTKSAQALAASRARAARLNRDFLDFNRAPREQKMDALRNPRRFHVFFDMRVSEMSDLDFRGVLSMTPGEHGIMEPSVPIWVRLCSNPHAAADIFLDEITLAEPNLQKLAYKVINERIVCDYALGREVYVYGASNYENDCPELVSPLPSPLKDRFALINLTEDNDFFLRFALNMPEPKDAGQTVSIRKRDESEIERMPIRPEVSAIIKENADAFFKFTDADRLANYRSAERVSKLIDALPEKCPVRILRDVLHGAIHKDAANLVFAYLKATSALDFEDFLNNPASWIEKFSAEDRSVLFKIAERAGFEMPISDLAAPKQDNAARRKKIGAAVSKLDMDLFMLSYHIARARVGKDAAKARSFDWSMCVTEKIFPKAVIEKIDAIYGFSASK